MCPEHQRGRPTPTVGRGIVAAVRGVPGLRLLDVQSDATHHRSVLTLAGDADACWWPCSLLVAKTLDVVDLRTPSRRAPATRRRRRGAVRPDRRRDAWPTASRWRARSAAEVADRFGVPVYLYEEAAADAGAPQPRGHPPRRVRRPGRQDGASRAGRPTSVRRRRIRRRRHRHRRADAAHRLQHQPRHRSARRRQEASPPPSA